MHQVRHDAKLEHNYFLMENLGLYLLTPRGIEEKAKITYHFLRRKTEEYERLEKEIQDLQKEVELLAKSATENR
jgi:hypothetical protein